MKWYDAVGFLLLPMFIGFVAVRSAVSYFPDDIFGGLGASLVLMVVGLVSIFWRDYVIRKKEHNKNVNTK
jgi:uncharacterized membrane-anchored protein